MKKITNHKKIKSIIPLTFSVLEGGNYNDPFTGAGHITVYFYLGTNIDDLKTILSDMMTRYLGNPS